MEVSQKNKNRTTKWPSNFIPGYILKKKKHQKMKTPIQKDICTSMFITALFTIAKTRKQPVSINRWMDKWMWYMHIIEYSSATNRNDKCYNMDETWKHYAKHRIQTQKPCTVWLHLYEIPRIGKSIEKESKFMVARDGGRLEWGVSVIGYGFLFGVMKMF